LERFVSKLSIKYNATVTLLSVNSLATEEFDRKTRRIAFIVITLVFIVSVVALLYWAINVASARLNERITSQIQTLSPRNAITEAQTILPHGLLVKLNTSIKI